MAGRRKRTPRLPFGVETPPVVNGRVNTRTARATGVVRDEVVPDPIPDHGSNSFAETGRMERERVEIIVHLYRLRGTKRLKRCEEYIGTDSTESSETHRGERRSFTFHPVVPHSNRLLSLLLSLPRLQLWNKSTATVRVRQSTRISFPRG